MYGYFHLDLKFFSHSPGNEQNVNQDKFRSGIFKLTSILKYVPFKFGKTTTNNI